MSVLGYFPAFVQLVVEVRVSLPLQTWRHLVRLQRVELSSWIDLQPVVGITAELVTQVIELFIEQVRLRHNRVL